LCAKRARRTVPEDLPRAPGLDKLLTVANFFAQVKR
jgi:hypothetical protein